MASPSRQRLRDTLVVLLLLLSVAALIGVARFYHTPLRPVGSRTVRATGTSLPNPQPPLDSGHPADQPVDQPLLRLAPALRAAEVVAALSRLPAGEQQHRRHLAGALPEATHVLVQAETDCLAALLRDIEATAFLLWLEGQPARTVATLCRENLAGDGALAQAYGVAGAEGVTIARRFPGIDAALRRELGSGGEPLLHRARALLTGVLASQSPQRRRNLAPLLERHPLAAAAAFRHRTAAPRLVDQLIASGDPRLLGLVATTADDEAARVVVAAAEQEGSLLNAVDLDHAGTIRLRYTAHSAAEAAFRLATGRRAAPRWIHARTRAGKEPTTTLADRPLRSRPRRGLLAFSPEKLLRDTSPSPITPPLPPAIVSNEPLRTLQAMLGLIRRSDALHTEAASVPAYRTLPAATDDLAIWLRSLPTTQEPAKPDSPAITVRTVHGDGQSVTALSGTESIDEFLAWLDASGAATPPLRRSVEEARARPRHHTVITIVDPAAWSADVVSRP